MKLFPSRREVNRAQARLVGRFFGVMLVVTLVFGLILFGRYVLGIW